MKQRVSALTNQTRLFYLIILPIFLCTEAAFSQITITENSPDRFSFEWNIDNWDTLTIIENRIPYSSFTFKGSDATVEQLHEPILPAYSLLIGVPAEGTVTSSVTVTSTASIMLNHPIIRLNKPEDALPHHNLTVEETNGHDEWISITEYIRMRSQRTASLLIKAARYNPVNRTVTLATKGHCTITFPKAAYRYTKSAINNEYEKTIRSLLANYDVAQGWKISSRLPKRLAADAYPLPPGKKSFYFKVGDGQSGYNEMTTNENGIMKLTGKEITDRLGTSDIAKVKVYASVKGMLPDSLPGDGSIPDGISECPLIRFDQNGNGTLDDDDYLLAYVSGASDWRGGRESYDFALDVYDDYRTFWITTGTDDGRTMEKMSPYTAEPVIINTSFPSRIRYKQSRLRKDNNPGNRKWLWKILSKNQRILDVPLDLSGIDEQLPGMIIPEATALDGSYAAISIGSTSIDDRNEFTKPIQINQWDSPTLHLEFAGTGDSGTIEITHFDMIYQRKLEIGDTPEVMTIITGVDDTGSITAYDLTIATDQPVYILRADQEEQQTVLIDTLKKAKGNTYRWIDSLVLGRRYIICNEAALFDMPELVEPDAPLSGTHLVTDLRSRNNRSDFLIITHPEFLEAADSLARHKKRIGFVNPVVVNVFDIYRYFSGGNKDAGAIRNFIGYVTRYWKSDISPDYVLLVGVGHYDTKNYINTATDFIPVYIDSDYCYENYYVRVAPSSELNTQTSQIAIGRLPCLAVDHAWAMVNKIVQTEDPTVADFGEWRNRMLFVADDDMQGIETDPVVSSKPHHISSDLTARLTDSLSPSIDIRKIYLFEYEWDEMLQKPGASVALINEINNGVGYINFFGHGADVTWTDEYILTADMVSRMNNHGRYPVVAAFSCSVGRFDLPGTECLSGVLARSAGIGSIASVSSTREAYAHANENLAVNFYSFLFDTLSANSIGMSLIAAQTKLGSSGHRTYCILGDPSIRAIRPTHRITLSIDDPNDTLEALQKVIISGSIDKLSGGVDKTFSGTGANIAIGLFNAGDTTTRKDGGTNYVSYQLPGTPLFLGKTSVQGGTFKQTVLVPQNCTFDKKGVKLTAYAWKDNSVVCGTGYKSDIIFHGSKSLDDIIDNEGPVITVRPSYDDDYLSGGNASFFDHLTVQVPVTCEVELYDSSGIDAAGLGPDEGITLEIEGVIERQNVNSKFQFKEGDFRRGIVSVVYEEKVLKPGTYTMSITGRDLIGNLSKSKFTLNVTDEDELDLDHVLNFPNPVRYGKTTRFYCHTSYTAQTYWNINTRLTIKIFTLSGKLVRVIKNARNGQRWDCRDEKGHLLSPDIYLYRIIAEDIKRKKTTRSKIMKLVIAPPK